jgi:hypothetical protein
MAAIAFCSTIYPCKGWAKRGSTTIFLAKLLQKQIVLSIFDLPSFDNPLPVRIFPTLLTAPNSPKTLNASSAQSVDHPITVQVTIPSSKNGAINRILICSDI